MRNFFSFFFDYTFYFSENVCFTFRLDVDEIFTMKILVNFKISPSRHASFLVFSGENIIQSIRYILSFCWGQRKFNSSGFWAITRSVCHFLFHFFSFLLSNYTFLFSATMLVKFVQFSLKIDDAYKPYKELHASIEATERKKPWKTDFETDSFTPFLDNVSCPKIPGHSEYNVKSLTN